MARRAGGELSLADFYDELARVKRSFGKFDSANLFAEHAHAARRGEECFSGMGWGMPSINPGECGAETQRTPC